MPGVTRGQAESRSGDCCEGRRVREGRQGCCGQGLGGLGCPVVGSVAPSCSDTSQVTAARWAGELGLVKKPQMVPM